MAYSSPSSSRLCSGCSDASTSCISCSSSCQCSEQLTASQNSSAATPTYSLNSNLLSNYQSPNNNALMILNVKNDFQSLPGSIQLSEDIDNNLNGDIESEDDNTTMMDSIYEENRIEDFDLFTIDIKNENLSEEEQERVNEELFLNEEVPDGVVLGKEIWIPPPQSQDMENVFAMENSVPYENSISCTPPYDRRLFLIKKIEDITHEFLDDLVNNRELKITHIKKTEWSNCNLIDNV